MRADVKVGDERHLIFATKDQLQLLGKAKQWFIDGTFKVVRAPFYQILSIHSFVRSGEECKMIPLVFCLMSRRRQKDYIKISQSITGMLQQQELKCVVVDFKIAMWGAVKKVMPGVKIKGCIFHMTQAIRVQKLRKVIKKTFPSLIWNHPSCLTNRNSIMQKDGTHLKEDMYSLFVNSIDDAIKSLL